MKDPRSFEQITLRPAEEWLDDSQDWRFARVNRGAAYWLAGPGSRALAGGEMLVLPPGARALVRASQINEVVLHTLRFAPALLAQVFAMEESQLIQRLQGEKAGEPQFLPSTHPAAQRFADLVANGASAGRIAQRAEALCVCAEVLDGPVKGHRPVVQPRTSKPQRFEQLVAPMPEEELLLHTAGQLARLCGCSARHFNRLYRTHFGVGFRARQTELRLLKAQALLAAQEARIRDVALESGYRNLSLFNSLFRRRFGVTPSEWRRTAAVSAAALPNGVVAGNSAR